MGCDIHIYAEIKKAGKWKKVGNVFKNTSYKPDGKNSWDKNEFTDVPYDGRNYDLFAILADVRNGYGYAGTKTGEGFNPISDPKGLPEDISNEVKKQSEYWDSDGHSHSYLTVSELINYNWEQETMHQGVISIDEYKKLQPNECPNGWSSMISGPNIKILTMDEVNNNYEVNYPDGTHVLYKWTMKYSEACQYFIANTIPELKKLGQPDEVRIVFWFDN